MVEILGKTISAYESGVVFWNDKIGKLIDNLSRDRKPQSYESLMNLEELELAQLKLDQLERRKERGMIK